MAKKKEPSLRFRLVVSGITAVSMMFIMSMAVGLVTGAITAAQPIPITGNFIGESENTGLHALTIAIVGLVTFLASFYFLSKS